MTNRLELNWKLDGFVDEQRYYCSETPIDPENLPTPKVVLNGDVRNYVDTAIEVGKTYFVRIGSVKNGIEKISEEISELAGILWTPDNLTAQIYLDADDLSSSLISSWTDRKTGVSFTQATTSLMPTLSTLNSQKAIYLDGSNDILSSDNIALTSILNNKSDVWLFIVMKKDGVDVSGVSRRVFIIETATGGTARFGFYADDATAGNVNKLVLGTRRLDSDSYNYLATSQLINNQAILAFGSIDYSTKNMKSILNGGVSENKTASFTAGATSATNSRQLTIGGGGGGVTTFKGWISAIVMGNTNLSDSDRQKLEGWAAHKYGLIDNLPSDHPYKILVPVI